LALVHGKGQAEGPFGNYLRESILWISKNRIRVAAGRVIPHGRADGAGLGSHHEQQHVAAAQKSIMSLMSLALTLIVVGVLLWLVNAYIPMDGKIKNILNIVVVICVVIWLLVAFGVIDRSGDIRVPKIQ
jgi:hypothetical protein